MPDYPLVFYWISQFELFQKICLCQSGINSDRLCSKQLAGFFVARTRYFPYLSGCYYEPVVAVISALGFICLGKIDIFHKKTDDISSMYGGIF